MHDATTSSRPVTTAVRRLLLGADRYRQAVADRYQITVPEVITLGDLYQHGPLTPRAVAEQLGWTTGGVTTLLDRLEAGGYVTRVPNPDDRRSVLIRPTPRGRKAMRWAFDRLDAAVDAATRNITDHDELIAFLDAAATGLDPDVDRRPG